MLSFGMENIYNEDDSDFLLYCISFYVLSAFFPIKSLFAKEYSDFYGVTWRRAATVPINVHWMVQCSVINLLKSRCF